MSIKHVCVYVFFKPCVRKEFQIKAGGNSDVCVCRDGPMMTCVTWQIPACSESCPQGRHNNNRKRGHFHRCQERQEINKLDAGKQASPHSSERWGPKQLFLILRGIFRGVSMKVCLFWDQTGYWKGHWAGKSLDAYLPNFPPTQTPTHVNSLSHTYTYTHTHMHTNTTTTQTSK